MEKPKLSIIIPMWNSSSFIIPCLKTVVGYDDVEVIVVDDGSKDNSVSVVKDFFKQHNGNYHVFKRPHQGISLTRRFGISKSHSDYIAFLDSDDRMNIPNYLYLLNQMKKHRVEVGMGRVSSGTNHFKIPSINLKFGEQVIDIKKDKHILSSFLTLITAKIWKKDLLKYYDSNGSANEDVECVPFMLAKANKVYATNKVIYQRINRKGSTSLIDICNVSTGKSIKNTVYPLMALKQRFSDNGLYEYYKQEVDAICMKHLFERLFNIRFSHNLKNKKETEKIVIQILTKVVPDFKENIHFLNKFKRMELPDYLFYRFARKKVRLIEKTDLSIEELISLYEKSVSS